MADNSNREPEDESEQNDLRKRFPAMPEAPGDVPEPPKIKVDLPPHPDRPKPGASNATDVRGSALAYQAASSFIMPIILLGLLGWFLDGRFHTNGIVTVLFFILGFVVGVVSLLKIVNQMDAHNKK